MYDKITGILTNNGIKLDYGGKNKGKFFSYEYYRIDILGWERINYNESRDSACSSLQVHSWKPIIAIEHENNFNDWSAEVIKLLFIRCPLRIVIGYSDRNADGKYDAEEDKKHLKKICSIINDLDPKSEIEFISKNETFGIILGNGNTKNDKTIKECNFKCYEIYYDENNDNPLEKYNYREI